MINNRNSFEKVTETEECELLIIKSTRSVRTTSTESSSLSGFDSDSKHREKNRKKRLRRRKNRKAKIEKLLIENRNQARYGLLLNIQLILLSLTSLAYLAFAFLSTLHFRCLLNIFPSMRPPSCDEK